MGAQHTGSRDAGRFEVVGCRLGETSAITHVGLLAGRRGVDLRVSTVSLHDVAGPRRFVRPPIRLPHHKEMPADILGWLPLGGEEEERLDVWLGQMRTQVGNVDYLALPAYRVETDPETGEILQWRFSCAGFVIVAYGEATGVSLVDQDALPPSDEGVIAAIWGPLARRKDILRDIGLGSPPPWPVLLPGPVLRALSVVGADNDRTCLPHQPTADDAWFPGERQDAGVKE